jgi:hypothetical protein
MLGQDEALKLHRMSGVASNPPAERPAMGDMGITLRVKFA